MNPLLASRLVVGISLVLSIALVPAHSATPPKAGSDCTKQGVTKTYKGKTFKCKKVKGKLVWNKGKVAKQAAPVASPSAGISTTASPIPTSSPKPTQSTVSFVQSPAVADAAKCKLLDARIEKTQPNNSGFPIIPEPMNYRLIPNAGIAEFVMIPVDFEDAPGSSEELERIKNQIEAFIDWFKFSSNGKLEVKFQIADRWFRASQRSDEYEVRFGKYVAGGKISPNSSGIMQEFIDLTGKTYDFSKVHGVFAHFPLTQKTSIEEALLGRDNVLRTPQGDKMLFYWADGNFIYTMFRSYGKDLPNFWAQTWVHEVLHSMGISLHAPGNGLSLGVGQNNFGYSWSLNGWETFKLEWWKDSQVYCLPIEQVTENNVVLSPVESMSQSYKLIIIPKSETKALIVESRRATGFSSAWPKDFYGLLVYELDTTLDNDRSQECCGDSGFDKRFQKWSYPLTPDQRPFSASLNNNLDQVNNFLVRVGETVSWEGIKVTYLEKGSADYIKITRS